MRGDEGAHGSNIPVERFYISKSFGARLLAGGEEEGQEQEERKSSRSGMEGRVKITGDGGGGEAAEKPLEEARPAKRRFVLLGPPPSR
ncbi:hypothetical protein GUJ93_ZPchr0006g46123 [Zizania palustris]|uniref:Uncharacterized protein n=1 Tax=Zizania palustris TaxID=103762 RepID=A0A8J5T1T8_ZIZPA|nr:hypothetical protein GUJ93_ZPchr0006g46123 [Zizania palustris]